MFLKSISLQNILSYGPEAPPLELRPLNVLIGPNGSGKSNLIDCIALLCSAPRSFADFLQTFGGSFVEWLRADGEDFFASRLTAEFVYDNKGDILQYSVELAEKDKAPIVLEEHLFRYTAKNTVREMTMTRNEVKSMVRVAGGNEVQIDVADLTNSESILSQRRDPDRYPAFSFLQKNLPECRFYREWRLGRRFTYRAPQRGDLSDRFLLEDFSNLARVLQRAKQQSGFGSKLLEKLKLLYQEVTDFEVVPVGDHLQIYLCEGPRRIPATRLSDGSLRFLALAVALTDPEPSPLLVIEEPEIGFHPDMMHVLVELLRETSSRTQLIVTTHSDILVDCFNDCPESVLVCEKQASGTQIRRLDPLALQEWMQNYSLGDLWRQGQLGGNRW